MFKIHGFFNNELVLNRYIQHLPREGDTLRLDDVTYRRVTEVVWCLDESTVLSEPVRINLRLAELKD